MTTPKSQGRLRGAGTSNSSYSNSNSAGPSHGAGLRPSNGHGGSPSNVGSPSAFVGGRSGAGLSSGAGADSCPGPSGSSQGAPGKRSYLAPAFLFCAALLFLHNTSTPPGAQAVYRGGQRVSGAHPVYQGRQRTRVLREASVGPSPGEELHQELGEPGAQAEHRGLPQAARELKGAAEVALRLSPGWGNRSRPSVAGAQRVYQGLLLERERAREPEETRVGLRLSPGWGTQSQNGPNDARAQPVYHGLLQQRARELEETQSQNGPNVAGAQPVHPGLIQRGGRDRELEETQGQNGPNVSEAEQPRRFLGYHPRVVVAMHAEREMLTARMRAREGVGPAGEGPAGDGSAGDGPADTETAEERTAGFGTAVEGTGEVETGGENSALEVAAMLADNEIRSDFNLETKLRPASAEEGAGSESWASEEKGAGSESWAAEAKESKGGYTTQEVALLHAARDVHVLGNGLSLAYQGRAVRFGGNVTRTESGTSNVGHSVQEVAVMHRAREALELRAKWQELFNRKGGHHRRGRRKRGGRRKGTHKRSGERPPPSLSQAMRNGFVRWPRVQVSAGGKISSFGFVATKGRGLVEARINERTCFLLSAWTRGGSSFDQGETQNAFFVPTIRQNNSNNTVLVGGVQYLPKWSFHRVCYTLPSPGKYSFLLRILFINTADLVSEIDPRNGRGYANYTVVMRTFITATAPSSPSPSKSPGEMFSAYRTVLPICTPRILMESWNAGFWVDQTWYPSACRLKRLGPQQIMQCLNGRNVAITGDSEMRILFGVLQKLLNSTSRAEFLRSFRPYPKKLLDLLGFCKAPTSPKTGPAIDPSTGKAVVTEYQFLGRKSVYHGGSYGGFSVRRVKRVVNTNRGAISVDFNLTYATYFNISQKPFEQWMWEGKLTRGGATVGDGGLPFDMLAMSNQIHAVQFLNSSQDLEQVLEATVLPRLQGLVKRKRSPGIFMFGALSCFEPRKLGSLYRFGNPRMVAFDAAAQRLFGSTKAGTFLQVHPITASRPDLALEATHYGWPVTLAMIDTWLGSTCQVLATAT